MHDEARRIAINIAKLPGAAAQAADLSTEAYGWPMAYWE
jgi:hypothetical protein